MSGCAILHRLTLLATSPVATGEAKIGEPRKGTETSAPSGRVSCRDEFKNQNPARGRKHVEPERIDEHGLHLRTRTPQGDGAYTQPLP